MNSLLQRLMIGGSTAAMFAAGASIPARAQDTAGQGVEQVVVSASRITIAGYTAPTPVTVISADSLDSAAKIDIGDSIRELPSVGVLSENLIQSLFGLKEESDNDLKRWRTWSGFCGNSYWTACAHLSSCEPKIPFSAIN